FLDRKLQENACQHDFSLLESYCKEKKLDFSLLAEWFQEQGGFCDCEILANVEEQFERLTKPTQKIQSKPTRIVARQKLDALTTDFGFSIKRVPAPWILVATSQGDKITYQFQIGKKSGFPVMLENDFPIDKLSEDIFLHNYWITKTELDGELEFTIDRQSIQNFEIVQVRTKRWSPIFVFAYRQGMKWCLLLRTETARGRNDVRELEKLLKDI
ncbi:MAG: DUF2695 domain-containing protein, partial [Helicobacteraceae bacterium]|nr:DUF2695 domain-containing protein [Helicobacteraceae bacterium]